MTDFELPHFGIFQELDSGQQFGELLFYPELSALAGSDDRLIEHLTSNCQTVINDVPLVDLFQRRQAANVEVADFRVNVRPERNPRWTEPVKLTFQAVVWQQTESAWLAYVPALGIEVFGKNRAQLDGRVPVQIQFALRRRNATSSLERLVAASRSVRVSARSLDLMVEIRTPKEVEEAAGRVREKSVLKSCATLLKKGNVQKAWRIAAQVARLADLVRGDNARSVLLCGPSGVGKTAVVHELVRSAEEKGMTRTVWSTSGSRIVSGTAGFGMWQERCQALVKELGRRRVVLHVGSLMELIESGRGGGSGQGVAGFLRAPIERGEVVIIAECTLQQRDVIERQEPGLVQALSEIRLDEPDPETGRAILADFAESRWSSSVGIEDDALQWLDRLHRRFATYSVYPGRPLRFLRNLLDDCPQNEIISTEQVTSAFSRETGLPACLLDQAVRFNLDDIHQWFSKRVLGQPQAVDLVVDMLAAVRAAMTRPGRPIASLLFIGPTGVGKTEMARTLAEFFYQDRHRMVRIDMSEYADPLAAERLIGGPYHGDGILTSRVRDQPFGVVLFDEFEKADPRCFDLLLQVLGEGRLTDGAGNVADFRNAIVIMTSNLGADTARIDGLGFGRSTNDDDATTTRRDELEKHYTRAVRSFLRPEMFNRIDRLVSFQPLDQPTLQLVAQRELELISSRDGIAFRGVNLEVDNAAANVLAQHGFDPRYGARPLKRAIERDLLRPLATGINRYTPDLTLTAKVAADAGNIDVSVRAQKAAPQSAANRKSQSAGERTLPMEGLTAASLSSAKDAVVFADRVAELRRRALRLESSSFVLDLRNEIYRLERQIERAISGGRKKSKRRKTDETKPKGYPDPEHLRRVGILQSFIGKTDSLRGDISSLEDDLLATLYSGQTVDIPVYSELLQTLVELWRDLLLEGFTLSFKETRTNVATLVVYGEQSAARQRLVDAYDSAARSRGYTCQFFSLLPSGKDTERRLPTNQFWVGKPERVITRNAETSFPQDNEAGPEAAAILIGQKLKGREELSRVSASSIGIALRLKGPLALPLLESERGNHVFIENGRSRRCYVDVATAPVEQYFPPLGIDRRSAYENEPNRRTWHTEKQYVTDPVLREQFRWNKESVSELLITILHIRLIREAESTLGIGDE